MESAELLTRLRQDLPVIVMHGHWAESDANYIVSISSDVYAYKLVPGF